MYSEGLDKKAVEERVLKLHHNTSQNRVDLYSGVCVSLVTGAGTDEQSSLSGNSIGPGLHVHVIEFLCIAHHDSTVCSCLKLACGAFTSPLLDPRLKCVSAAVSKRIAFVTPVNQSAATLPGSRLAHTCKC